MIAQRNLQAELRRLSRIMGERAVAPSRNREGKRYRPEVYERLLAARRERERVTGNKEKGPL
jgi:hypothetical protein